MARRTTKTASELVEALGRLALRYPESEEGVACAGTALEKHTAKARGKAFLFWGAADAMLKLQGSLDEARALAAKAPGRFKVGAHGWVTLAFAGGEAPPLELLERWIDESYRAVAPAALVASLQARTKIAPAKARPRPR